MIWSRFLGSAHLRRKKSLRRNPNHLLQRRQRIHIVCYLYRFKRKSLETSLFLSFGGSSKTEKQEETVRSKYMPAEETPIEEAFTLKFTQQGGKFIYCEDKKESVNVFKNILAENGWDDCEMLCFGPNCKSGISGRPSPRPKRI